MKALLVIFLIAMSNVALADGCFQLSEQENAFTDQSDILCVSLLPSGSGSEVQIDLYSFASGSKSKVASYFLNSMPSAADTDVFGVSALKGSSLDDSIQIAIGDGEIYIGEKMYYSREAK